MRLALTLLTLVLLISTKQTYSQTAPTTLRPNTPIERSINRSESVNLEIVQQAIMPRGVYSPSAAYLNSRFR